MKSTLKTTAAKLREIIKEKDRYWAEDILGKSVHTIRHLEAGTLKLSPAMATKMSQETGISVKWLMNGDPKADPVSVRGEPYKKETYDEVRARKKTFATVEDWQLSLNAVGLFGQLRAVMVNANRNRNYYMAFYRIDKAVQELRTEFGEAEDIYPRGKGETKALPAMMADVDMFMASAKGVKSDWKELFKRAKQRCQETEAKLGQGTVKVKLKKPVIFEALQRTGR